MGVGADASLRRRGTRGAVRWRLLTFTAFKMASYSIEVDANSRLGAYSNKY